MSPQAASPFNTQLRARLEARAERNRNERCTSSQLYSPLSSCRGGLQPGFAMQFALKSSGTIGDRLHVDVDYDTQREFDASNSVSVSYVGDAGDIVQRLEVGNVRFATPASRFLNTALPGGNYGFQAIGALGPLQLRAVAAQQKGNVPQVKHFTIGSTASQQNEREIADYQVEPRRFFFTIDPALLRGYPNIDLLDAAQLATLRNELPDTLRPQKVYLYRLRFGAQPQNPNGPRFRLQGQPGGARQTYDVLREGIDYYVDPSMLWVALVRPVDPANERLVVAYTVRVNGQDTTWATTGGTPDLQAMPNDQVANLLWDPNVAPGDSAFRREIRSVYRLAGPELQRASVKLRVVTGASSQERPEQPNDGAHQYATYLEMLGLSQANNASEFDAESRIWPRTVTTGSAIGDLGSGFGDQGSAMGSGFTDPSLGASPSGTSAVSGIAGSSFAGSSFAGSSFAGTGIAFPIKDQFLVLPSLRPFALRDSGLIVGGNPANDAIYTTRGEYLYSPQHPPAVYRMIADYATSGGGAGTLDLGAVQIRPGSDRVLMAGRLLTRDVDYRMDYELGRLVFLRPDTLFNAPRDVEVSYQENPVFSPAPTSTYGLVGELPFRFGSVAFTAVSQSQRSTFTRPQLGFEPAGSLVAGLTGELHFDAPLLSRALSLLPSANAGAPSRLTIRGELASTHPQGPGGGIAYLETFEGDGGAQIPLGDPAWAYSSLPAYGNTLATRFGALSLEPSHAATMAWQNNTITAAGQPITFSYSQIDSLGTIAGAGFDTPEQILWLTLYPLQIGGRLNRSTGQYDWTVPNAPTNTRRFRSIRTVLSPSGADLSRAEYLEFWTLADTSADLRARNPTLVVDLGDVSENAVAFAPETLTVKPHPGGGTDSLFTGKRLQGWNVLDTERDPFSHAFDASRDDHGLPGDLIDTITVVDETNGAPVVRQDTNVPMCSGGVRGLQVIGDTRTNCTRDNWRLDEEDIDQDGALNLDASQREQEKILRYVIDLSDPRVIARVGHDAFVPDTVAGQLVQRRKPWVLVRIPLSAPEDSLGTVDRRRLRAVRLTMVSSAATPDGDFVQLPLDRLRLVGAPWVKRDPTTLAGIAGEHPAGGFVIASLIGTVDRDTARGIDYTSPPGVSDVADSRSQLQGGTVVLAEHSMRVQAGDLPLDGRAEAYYRFPTGERTLMGYRELRLWARGRGAGWGPGGELQWYIRLGRDPANFYLYRGEASDGTWGDEARIDLTRFYALRERIQNAYLAGADSLVDCDAVGSALVTASGPSGSGRRFVACDGPYMAYTEEPGAQAPNLAAVQELAAGIVRVNDGGGIRPLAPGDTAEVWLDELRLAQPVRNAGLASNISVELTAGDAAEFRVGLVRRDANFHQLGELPSFLDDRSLDFSGTLHLERFLPQSLGFALPLTITRSTSASQPLFLTGTDIRGSGVDGLRTPRTDFTTYTLSLRRVTPMRDPLLGAVLDHLALTGSYATGASQSEYQRGGSHRFSLGLDWLLADSARFLEVPLITRSSALGGWLGMRNGQSSGIRWNPTTIRFSSGVDRASDRRFAYAKPAGSPDDEPRLALALTDYWRNAATVELQPVPAFTARWQALTLRDLRQYGDTNLAATLATQARGSILGMDAGLERERGMQSSLSFVPTVTGWFRPRADAQASYAMLRDPNTRLTIGDALPGGTADTLADALPKVLPRRVSATQALTAGASLDVARALFGTPPTVRDSSALRRFVRAFQPLDLSARRSIVAAYDGTQSSPSLALQLGLAGMNGYRGIGADLATAAAQTTTLGAAETVILPMGAALTARTSRTGARSWMLRADGTQGLADGTQVTFPDLMLRWRWRPGSRDPLVSSASASLGIALSGALTSLPGDGFTSPELRRSHMRALPASASFAWGPSGSFTTGASMSLTRRVDSLPGSLGTGNGRELSFDVGHRFRMPSAFSLGLHDEIRMRAGYQRSTAQGWVQDIAGGQMSRILDQGRTAFNVDADTDLSDAMVFSLQGSRVVTFDNNLNQRVSQLLFSAVLQIDFSGLVKH